MIGKLRGKVDAIGESHAIIDVNGVGYEVQISSRTLRNLKHGDEVTLTIDTHVREDAIRLYGFQSEVERSWFRTLQSVQGVGSKVALAVLGTLGTQDLASAIALGTLAIRRAGARRRQEAGATHHGGVEGQGAGAVGCRAACAGRHGGRGHNGRARRQRRGRSDLGAVQSRL